MSRGRHAQPAPPSSDTPLMLVALIIAVAAVAAVWLVDEAWALRAGVTGIVVLAAVAVWISSRAASSQAQRYWSESVQQRREVAQTHQELAELKTQHFELLLEIRTMREEAMQLTQETARIASDDAEQRAIIRQMLQPRAAALDPVYPSLHLPLVRAAFSTELPASPVATPRPTSPGLRRESTTGGEAQPNRQLLDLTASEIARLRTAN
ncbi:MAG: hypothetical protein ABI720_08325 [Actinomycetes bacterium]